MTGLPVTQSFYGAQLGVVLPAKVREASKDHGMETAVAAHLLLPGGSQLSPTELADRMDLKVVTVGPDTFIAVHSTYRKHRGPGWTKVPQPEPPSKDAEDRLAWVARHLFIGHPCWVVVSSID